MNYTYSLSGSEQYIVFKFGEGFEVLDYVFEEMSNFSSPIFKEFIERVVSGESEIEKIGGNMCYMTIKKDYTLIYPANEFDDSNELTINTEYLLELINLWVEKNKCLSLI